MMKTQVALLLTLILGCIIIGFSVGKKLTDATYQSQKPILYEDMPSNKTREEMIGSRFIWGIHNGPTVATETAQFLTSSHAGGVLILGSYTTSELTEFVKNIRAIQPNENFLITIDQEGGTVRRLIDDVNTGGDPYKNISDETVCAMMKNTGEQLKAIGIDKNFGLVADIGWNTQSYIFPRTFGTTPQDVSDRITLIKSCQNFPLVLKHFPGHGRTILDTHFQIKPIDITESEWKKTDLLPFQAGIDAGIQEIMIGHLIYPFFGSDPASMNTKVYDYLRTIGFHGITYTDDIGMLLNSGWDMKEVLAKTLCSPASYIIYASGPYGRVEIFSEALHQATSSGCYTIN